MKGLFTKFVVVGFFLRYTDCIKINRIQMALDRLD